MNGSESNIRNARQLLDQIIEKNEYDDKLVKASDPNLSGEGWNVFNLKTLRDLLNEIWENEVK